jgi:NAD(P)-dependent dehydrogenase (short-subunit alcohol dehydrogenase family)
VRLQDKVSIITGGASGIGEACVRRFAAEGAKIVSADIGAEKGEAVVDDVCKRGGSAVFVACDISTADSAAKLVNTALSAFGHLDCIICAAGIAPTANFLELSETQFDSVLKVNLNGPLLLGQAAARYWVESGTRGSIVNVTSVSARLAGAGQAAYCASKGALDSLTRVMAVALAPHGIRVNALAPGPTRTGMAASVWDDEEALRPVLSRTPLGRFAEPDEQASVAAFLVSDDASFMTGETVYVDGGRLALNYTVPVKPRDERR